MMSYSSPFRHSFMRLFLPFLAVLLLHNNATAIARKMIRPMPGATQIQEYLPLLNGKKVALIINQTSVVGKTSLLDTLLRLHVKVVKIFVPEHGFRGTASAGAKISNDIDDRTGLPVISLYGKNKKPTAAQLADVDILIYDLQDVGVRFYTYISTLQYAMEACGEYGKQLMVLDRPNPNGYYVDGPVLDTSLRSFVGMQPVPVVYGMTAGEYAGMLVGERWIPYAEKLDLKVIRCYDYNHRALYNLPVAPSPNLKTMAAVYLYPSLCLLEGTVVSLGRGTGKPFQQWGHPDFKSEYGNYYFIPKTMPGATKPVLEGKRCYGVVVADNAQDALDVTASQLNLRYVIDAYRLVADKTTFFTPFFTQLAGTRELRPQIEKGMSEEAIRASWQPALDQFKEIRKKYLLYE